MKRALLAVLVGWLLGIATALGGVAVTGGWYEYHIMFPTSGVSDGPILDDLITNSGGWQPVPGLRERDPERWFRRPRIQLGDGEGSKP